MNSFVFTNSDTNSFNVGVESFSHSNYYAPGVISLFFKIEKKGGGGTTEVRLNTAVGDEVAAMNDISRRMFSRDKGREMVYRDTGIIREVRNYRGLRLVSVGSEYDSPFVTGVDSITDTDPTPATVAAGVPLEGKPGQIIVKSSNTDYDTTWRFLSSTVTGDQLVAALEAITAGDPVYIHSADADYIYVKIADADDATAMPCVGVANSTVSYGDSVDITTHGLLDVEIFGYTSVSVGDILYVSDAGDLTTTRPTSSTAKVQNVGVVTQVNSAGTTIEQIMVHLQGHEEMVPNLADGAIFLGGVANQISPYTFPLSDGTANQVLTTDGSGSLSFTNVSGGGGGGGGTIDSNLSVTNSIGDAVVGTTYSSGTDLEDIIRDILAPFTEPTIVSTVPSSSNTNLIEGNNIIFPTGQTSTIDSYTVTVTDFGNLEDGVSIVNTSVQPSGEDIEVNASYVWTGNSATFSSLSYSPTVQTSHGAAATVTFTLSYLSNNGAGSAVNLTSTASIIFRDEFYVVASSTGNTVTVSGLLGDSVVHNSLGLANVASQTHDFDCSSDTVNNSNFTYLIIPAIFTIQEIAASVSGRGVADYTDSFELLGSSYSYTAGSASRTYKIYKSRQTGAFDSDVSLHLTISKP
jgi:hypothetical protein